MRAIGTGQQTAGIALMLFSGHLAVFGRTVWHLGNVLIIASSWIIMWGDEALSWPARGRDVLFALGVVAASFRLIFALVVWRPFELARSVLWCRAP